MATPSTIATSTFLQRGRILAALKKVGLSKAFITDEHTPLLEAAGLRAEYGTPLIGFLRGISYQAATRLLHAIRAA